MRKDRRAPRSSRISLCQVHRFQLHSSPHVLIVNSVGCRLHCPLFWCPLLPQRMDKPILVTYLMWMALVPNKETERPWKETTQEEKKSKLRSGSGHVLRKDAHLLVCSMVYNMIFYPLSHLVVTAALESRCHYSYFTVEKGGTKVGQWTCMSHMRSRERNQPQDTPAMPLPPWVQEVRKAAAP